MQQANQAGAPVASGKRVSRPAGDVLAAGRKFLLRASEAEFTGGAVEMAEIGREAAGKTAWTAVEAVARKEATPSRRAVRGSVRREGVRITRDGVVEAGPSGPAGTVSPVRR